MNFENENSGQNMGTFNDQGTQQQTQQYGMPEQPNAINGNQQQYTGYGPQNMNGYGNPPQMYQQQKKSALGLVGLILTIISLFGCGALLAIPGIICCIIAFVRDKSDKKALVGTIIGIISIILWIVLWIVFAVSVSNYTLHKIEPTVHELNTEDTELVEKDTEEDSEIIDDTENDKDTEADKNTENVDAQSANEPLGSDVAGDFDPSKVVYKGVTLQMDQLTATEVQNLLGVQFNEKDMNYVVNSQYYSYTTYHVNDSLKEIIYFYFYNDASEAKPLSECKLYRVYFYTVGENMSDWLDADFGSGLNASSTIDDVKAVLGEPDNTYDSDEFDTHSVEYYKKWDYKYKVSFQYTEGKLTEVQIGYY